MLQPGRTKYRKAFRYTGGASKGNLEFGEYGLKATQWLD